MTKNNQIGWTLEVRPKKGRASERPYRPIGVPYASPAEARKARAEKAARHPSFQFRVAPAAQQ